MAQWDPSRQAMASVPDCACVCVKRNSTAPWDADWSVVGHTPQPRHAVARPVRAHKSHERECSCEKRCISGGRCARTVSSVPGCARREARHLFLPGGRIHRQSPVASRQVCGRVARVPPHAAKPSSHLRAERSPPHENRTPAPRAICTSAKIWRRLRPWMDRTYTLDTPSGTV